MVQLYHARRIPGDSVKEELEPTQAPAQVRNGKMGQYLYATHRVDQSYLYALPFPGVGSGVSFMDTAESGDHDGAIVRFHGDDSKKVRRADFSNHVYSMSSESFEQVESNPREWIASCAVKVDVEARVAHIDQALARGIQYFTLAEGAPKDSFAQASERSRAGNMSREYIAELVAKPDSACVWENEVSGLGVDKKIAARVDEKRKAYLSNILGREPSSEVVEELASSWRKKGSGSENASGSVGSGELDHSKRMELKDALSMAHAGTVDLVSNMGKKIGAWRSERGVAMADAATEISHQRKPQ